MTTKNFRVRNGLEVGNNFTVDSSGNVTVGGDLTVNGATTTLNTTELLIEDNKITLNSNVTGTPSTDAGIEIERGSSTNSALTWNETTDKWEQNRAGTSTVIAINTSELAEGSNLYYTDARARAALSGGTGVTYNTSTGAIAIGQAVGTTDSPTFNNLTLTGGGITNTTTNGAVTLTPNGTGDLAVVLSNGGNLTNTRNYVFGTIRDATTDTNGDMWSFVSGTTGYRGITVDNSTTTTKRPGIVLRSFSASGAAVTPRSAFIGEGSRGTPASPTAIQTNDFIGEFIATGRTSTGWVSDLVAAAPAGQTYYATEAWTALTNVGTGWALALQPTATTLTSGGASRITVIDATPQAINTRSDGFNIKSKAGTNLLTVDSDGRLQVFNTNATNQNNIYGYATKIYSATTENAQGNNITLKPGKLTGSSSYDKQTELSVIQNTTDGAIFASYEMKTQKFDGTNYSATASGNTLGRLLFNGNYAAGANPAINQPGATVVATATENWTSSAAGTKMVFSITKTGTNTNLAVIDAASTSTVLKTDSYSFKDSSNADYLSLSSTKAQFYKPVQFPTYTRTEAAALAGSVGQQICITDSAGSGGGRPNGLMAYWDTTNTRWSYIHDNAGL